MNPECEKYRIEINSFLDGEGIEETGHESSCSACRLYKNEIVEMRKLFRENRDVPIPDALEKRILESAEKTFPHAFFGPKTFQAAWFSGWAGNLCFLTVALIILGTFFFRDAKSSNLLWTRMKMAPSQMIDSVFRLSSKVNASFTFRSGSVLTIWGGPAKITFDQENFDRGGKQTLGCSVDEGHACFSFAGQRSELFFVTFELGKVVSSGAIFRIVCLENGERRIDVSNGKTQLITPGQTVVLSALQTVSISSDGKISPIEDFDPSSDPEMKASFQK